MKSGNQNRGSIPTYPDDSIQNSILPDHWWVDDGKRDFQIGRLVYAFLPFVDQDPTALRTIKRVSATEHKRAIVEFVPIDVKMAVRFDSLPCAPLPQNRGETRCVYLSKRRPSLIVNIGGPEVPYHQRENKPRKHTDPCILVAPFYGEDPDECRAGYSEAFVERVRRCEYPQFFWDSLPVPGAKKGSILRLDQTQPVGRNHSVVEVTNYRLSDEALFFVNEFLHWFFGGEIIPESLLEDFKITMSNVPYLCSPNN